MLPGEHLHTDLESEELGVGIPKRGCWVRGSRRTDSGRIRFVPQVLELDWDQQAPLVHVAVFHKGTSRLCLQLRVEY